MMIDQSSLRSEIIATCKRMNAAGLNVGSAGNLSVRIDKGFLVTPSGIAYDDLVPENIVEMDVDGRYYGALVPTSEWRFHHAILKARPDVGVVLHSHATYCAILACCRLDIPPIHYMIAAAGGDVIKCSDYAPFGTPELSEMVLAALEDRNACLLGNHGVLVTGKSIEKAFCLLEEVENLAKTYVFTRLLGAGVPLDAPAMGVVLERFKTYGKQPDELAKMGELPKNRVEPPVYGGPHLG